MGNLIWLASYPKSGNTWMRAFLHNVMLKNQRPHGINRLDDLTTGDVTPEHYAAIAGRPLDGMTASDIAALRAPVQAALADQANGTRFIKTHSAVLEFAGHPTINVAVTAGAIYIIRNPLDVVVSFSHHLGRPVDDVIDLMATQNSHTSMSETLMIDFIGSWSQHVESWTGRPNPGLHVVRYEDMLDETHRTFAGVVKFLGLDVPRQHIERAVRHASFKVLRKQEETDGFVERSEHAERFFRVGEKGQWCDVLSDDQVARVVESHRADMERFGYVPRGH
ncbi:MAG: sulfotransferase domain-containing protein [Pseudomonadota bacterium]